MVPQANAGRAMLKRMNSVKDVRKTHQQKVADAYCDPLKFSDDHRYIECATDPERAVRTPALLRAAPASAVGWREGRR